MEKRRSALRVAAAGAICAAATACASVSSLVGLGPAVDQSAVCPTFGRMTDADRLIRFDGRVGDPARVLFEAEIIDVAAQCDLDDGEFEVAAGMRVRARAGPAWTGGPFEIPVVIAQVSGRRDVLRREQGVVVATPVDGATRAEGDFTAEYEIRVAGRDALADDRILFGLRLSRAELNYLRSR